MNVQHLSDEAVAAFADGVLRGHARERASRHLSACGECRQAVTGQREAAMALRSAPAPALPSSLLDRLRTVPLNTPITTLPTAIADDGSTVLATFAPMAALVPPESAPGRHRVRPFLTAAALVGVAGVLVAGSSSRPGAAGNGSTPAVHPVNRLQPAAHLGPADVAPANVFRGSAP
jgi:hypothetical protein